MKAARDVVGCFFFLSSEKGFPFFFFFFFFSYQTNAEDGKKNRVPRGEGGVRDYLPFSQPPPTP
ncbi:MAG: hypothetical protein WC763_07370, partial [Candidatus Paceibacterota bacterium]